MPTNSVFPTPIYAEMAHNSEYEEIQSELTEALQSLDFHHPSLGDGHDLSLGEDGNLFSDNILEKYKCHKFLAFLYKNVMRYVADSGCCFVLPFISLKKLYDNLCKKVLINLV